MQMCSGVIGTFFVTYLQIGIYIDQGENILKRLILILLPMLILISCGSGSNGNDNVADLIERKSLIEEEIGDVIGEASCGDLSQCKAIAFGSKPCGGPWSYLIYSEENIDTQLLELLVEEYNDIDERLNQIQGAESDCGLVAIPDVECENSRCVEI